MDWYNIAPFYSVKNSKSRSPNHTHMHPQTHTFVAQVIIKIRGLAAVINKLQVVCLLASPPLHVLLVLQKLVSKLQSKELREVV